MFTILFTLKPAGGDNVEADCTTLHSENGVFMFMNVKNGTKQLLK